MVDEQLVMDVAEHVYERVNFDTFKDQHVDDQEGYIEDSRVALKYLEERGLLKEAP